MKEGVYYSYFIYERVPLSQDSEQATDTGLDDKDDIESKSGGHHLMSFMRRLEAQAVKGVQSSKVTSLIVNWAKEPHLEING